MPTSPFSSKSAGRVGHNIKQTRPIVVVGVAHKIAGVWVGATKNRLCPLRDFNDPCVLEATPKSCSLLPKNTLKSPSTTTLYVPTDVGTPSRTMHSMVEPGTEKFGNADGCRPAGNPEMEVGVNHATGNLSPRCLWKFSGTTMAFWATALVPTSTWVTPPNNKPGSLYDSRAENALSKLANPQKYAHDPSSMTASGL